MYGCHVKCLSVGFFMRISNLPVSDETSGIIGYGDCDSTTAFGVHLLGDTVVANVGSLESMYTGVSP